MDVDQKQEQQPAEDEEKKDSDEEDIEISGNLSPLESLFFHITKVLLYKTITSPLRITHLLLQSKNVILERHQKASPASTTEASSLLSPSTWNTIKSWMFWSQSTEPTSPQTQPPMITYLTRTNSSIFPKLSIFASSNVLNFIHNIVTDHCYGLSYLFVGNLYNIMRGTVLHSSCHRAYHPAFMQSYKDKYIGDRYDEGSVEYTAESSATWLTYSLFLYPFHSVYLNYLFNFDGSYKSPALLSRDGIVRLYAGFPLLFLQSMMHGMLYYNISDTVDEVFMVRRLRNDLMGKTLSRYIAMGITNVLCYPLDTLRKRQMVSNENVFSALYHAAIKDESEGWWSLYDGLYVYLMKQLVAQICIDSCDVLADWYKSKYKVRKLRQRRGEQERAQSAELICNICFEDKKEYVFSCGHCVCAKCKDAITMESSVCHICRSPITSVQRMYI